MFCSDFKGLIQLNLQGNSLTGPIPSGFLSSVPGNEPITIKLGTVTTLWHIKIFSCTGLYLARYVSIMQQLSYMQQRFAF